MQYTDNEAALIGGLISNYFFQPSVDAKLRESYRRVLCHLHEDTLSASDLSPTIPIIHQDIERAGSKFLLPARVLSVLCGFLYNHILH